MKPAADNQGSTIAQVAKRLGKSKRTVERYIAAGILKVEYVEGKFGDERRIREIPLELLAEKQEEGQGGQIAPSQGDLPIERRVSDPVIVETRVVRIHWGVYLAILICFGLALAGLIAALHALDVAYWIGGG